MTSRVLFRLVATHTVPSSSSINWCLTGNVARCSSMPQNKEYVRALQKQRERDREKYKEHGAQGFVKLQVIGSGAQGAAKSLYFFTDRSRFLFNCGEGTQRLAHEHKLKLSKLEHIFITSSNWKNIGGIPGMILTLQEYGIPELMIHGPDGTMDLFNAMKRFSNIQEMKLVYAPIKQFEPYANSAFTLWYVPISKSSKGIKETTDADPAQPAETQGSTEVVNSNGKRRMAVERSNKKQKGRIGERISDAVSYICKLKPLSGALSLEKCIEKGVTPGPNLGLLKSGKDISLPDGTIVRSQDVCLPETPGAIFLVVDCPTEDHLDSFVNHEAFARHQATVADEVDKAYCVIHFTPEKVLANPRYRAWMDKFASSTRHIVINDANDCWGSEAVHKFQHQLHLIHPDIFPFLDEECFKNDKENGEDHPLIHRAKSCLTVHLQPKRYLDSSLAVKLQSAEYVKEAFDTEGFLDALAELQTNVNAQTKLLKDTSEYPKIVMLGTGSSIPNKTRNTSGILLRIDEQHSMIMDCGEGTMCQLRRNFGKSKIENVLASIKAIFISHLHADHHLGLLDILGEREKVTKDPLYLIAPADLYTWLELYDGRFEPVDHLYKMISNANLIYNSHKLPRELESDLCESLNVQRIDTTVVNHCANPFGVSVTLKDNRKIVYSGDTMPSMNLIKMGSDCDLLIHEATMEDNLQNEAALKLHSSTSQAIKVGQLMKAKFVLLTHFSQRYSRIPLLPENNDDLDLSNVGIAYDNMHVSLSQLPLLPLFYSTLKILFHEHYARVEERTMKRQRRFKSVK